MIRFVVLGLALLAACPSRAALLPADALGRPVTRVMIENRSRVPTTEVESLFLLRPGDVYEVAVVRRSLELLAQKVEIRNVIVRAEEQGSGLALRVEVVPEPLVRSIGFRGNRALRAHRLTPRLRTRVDRPAREQILALDATAIEQTYDSEGFPAARVTPRVEFLSDEHWLRVVFEVEEGPPRRIVRLEVPEGLPVEPDEFARALGLKKGDPASQPRLKEGLRRLTDLLWRSGYPEARAKGAGFQAEGDGAALVLPLMVGDPVDLRLEGIDEWAGRPLRELYRSRLGQPIDETWAGAVADLMQEHLALKGYRSARVDPELGRLWGRRRVTFHVTRGPRVRVDSVDFDGNRAIPSRRLRRYMSLMVGGILRPPPLTQRALDDDLKTLRNYYLSEGYLDARVALLDLAVPPSGKARLLVHIDEGQQYLLRTVAVECDEGLTVERARIVAGIGASEAADPGILRKARLQLLEELERNGYPDAQVEYSEVTDSDAARVDVSYRVVSGPQVRFGKTVISGNARTKTHVIRRGLSFHEGEPWNREEMLRSEQRLYRLGFFQRVRIEPLPTDENPGVWDVRVDVEEQDAGSVAFGLGYGSEEKVKGFAAVAHSNLQGLARSLELRADYDAFDESYALNFKEPWLFNYKIDFRASIVKSFQDRKSFNLSSLAFQTALDREFTRRIKGALVYTLERDRLTGVDDEATLSSSDEGTNIISAVGPLVVWDSRDDAFNPKRGFHHTLRAELALNALGSEIAYERFLGSASGYFTVGRYTLALQTRGGFALDHLTGTADLPINKRFFLGGRSTMRAFERDKVGPRTSDGSPIGGDTMLNLRAEIRLPLWKELGAAVFWDGGNVWNRSIETPDYSELRHGVGAGLRYTTPVGPFSIDVGFKLDKRRREDPYEWHFTAGNVF